MKFLTKYVLGLIVLFVVPGNGSAQDIADLKISNQTSRKEYKAEMIPFTKVLKSLEQKRHISFLYQNPLIESIKAPKVWLTSDSLAFKVEELLTENGLAYHQQSAGVYVIRKTSHVVSQQQETVTGTVIDDSTRKTLPGVNISVKGTSIGTITNAQGEYSLDVNSLQDTLMFSYIGYQTKTVPINGRSNINISLVSKTLTGGNLVVIGYGSQQEKNITTAVSSTGNEAIEVNHNGGTVSEKLVGKIPGVTVRDASGRPGQISNVEVRNMGTPLYIIDGVQADVGEFNELGSNDIQDITVLKGAGAAIYGSQAANGVVIVTTKSGQLDTPTKVGINAYVGWQKLSNYPNNVQTDGYNFLKDRRAATLNSDGPNANVISDAELQKWKEGKSIQYESFDWPDFIYDQPAPKTHLNVYASGGSDKTKFYFSYSRLDQDAVFRKYNFNRNNIQVNVSSQIADRLKVGVKMSGRIETRVNPGVPGYDDYNLALYAPAFTLPTQHPFANNNSKYLNDLGQKTNYNPAFWTFDRSGKYSETYKSIKPTFFAKYNFPLEGLSARASYGYLYRTRYLANHEKTFDAYTYNPQDSTYARTGGSTNPFQEKGQDQIDRHDAQFRLNYDHGFGKHNINATLGTEWYRRQDFNSYVHNVPAVNQLDLIKFNALKEYNDNIFNNARINFVGRINYNYDNTYFASVAASENGSFRFPRGKRFGFFPSFSAGWRITNEPFVQNLLGKNSVLSNLKIRASYGILGDDNTGIGDYAYQPGYTYDVATYIFDGETVNTTASRGVPTTNVTWFESHVFDIGIDYGFFDNKLSGSVDYFHRKRTGLLGNRYDVVIPNELGYGLPQQNQNSDAVVGFDGSINYKDRAGNFTYAVGGNITLARHRDLHTFNPTFGNSWDRYRNSIEDRWSSIQWGLKVKGRFQSQEEINNYNVDIDGQGNSTLLPGDFIYEDYNNDGVINGYDQRPLAIGNNNPVVSGGIHLNAGWKGIDVSANFAYGGLFAYTRRYEARIPYYSQSNGNLIKSFLDAWHREDPTAPNSKWIPGKYPPLRIRAKNHSNYRGTTNTSFWTQNISYLRLRTLQIGYTLPQKWVDEALLKKARIYVNGTNLFEIDNSNADYLDPTITRDNGFTYPQTRSINLGVNITF